MTVARGKPLQDFQGTPPVRICYSHYNPSSILPQNCGKTLNQDFLQMFMHFPLVLMQKVIIVITVQYYGSWLLANSPGKERLQWI